MAPRDVALHQIVTLARLARIMDKYADPALPLPLYRVLGLIAEGDSQASRLARKLAVGKPTITASVESLLARGYIARAGSAADRRAVVLTLTPAGERALASATATLEAVLAEILERCADPDLVRTALAQLSVALEERAEARDDTRR